MHEVQLTWRLLGMIMTLWLALVWFGFREAQMASQQQTPTGDGKGDRPKGTESGKFVAARMPPHGLPPIGVSSWEDEHLILANKPYALPSIDISSWEAFGPDGSLNASRQLTVLCQRAESGQIEDLKRLARWAALLEYEAQLLRRRTRKQQHDFNTLIEIVGQTSARSLDLGAMETYVLRTVSGHFATSKLLIMRRMKVEDNELICSCAQGMCDPKLGLPVDSSLCKFALEQRFSFSIKELTARPPEVQALLNLGVDLAVPLVQEVEASGAVLEGLLLLGPRMVGQYNDENTEFLHTLAKIMAICLRNETLYRRSIIDDLTGVASRGHFDARLSQEINRITTYGHRNMGLLMLDLDNFKLFNDRYGHQTGDRALQELAGLLVRQVRTVDLVARYGGEEFAIILLEIDRAKVLEVAERLCASVAQMEVLSPKGEKLGVTVSIGMACFPNDALDKSTLIELADEAMYRSKALGKNRVTATDPGAGKKRAALGLRPIGTALESGANFLAVDSDASGGPPLARRNPVLPVGLYPAELQVLRDQRREIAGCDSSGDPEDIPPRPKERRGFPPLPAPPSDKDDEKKQ